LWTQRILPDGCIDFIFDRDAGRAKVAMVEGLAANHASSQASLAHRCGYADEPHLVREFRSLTGLTPAALLAERRVGFVQVADAVSG
jgi:AraC-like DNA-binding protein